MVKSGDSETRKTCTHIACQNCRPLPIGMLWITIWADLSRCKERLSPQAIFRDIAVSTNGNTTASWAVHSIVPQFALKWAFGNYANFVLVLAHSTNTTQVPMPWWHQCQHTYNIAIILQSIHPYIHIHTYSSTPGYMIHTYIMSLPLLDFPANAPCRQSPFFSSSHTHSILKYQQYQHLDSVGLSNV